jgi:ATP-dependent DNA ligase
VDESEGNVIDGTELMLATLTDQRFSDPGWLFDRKLDGEACLAVRDPTGVRLESRTGHDLTANYPEVTAALVDAQPVPAGTHWVNPQLVAQIAFAEWTTAGRLRQPRFLGLEDKSAAEVIREIPENQP